MTPKQAIAFVRKHGLVLESGRGPAPSLAQAVAGGPIRGSWWAHPDAQRIFAATRAARESKDMLVCRLLGGKITYVHRRLWPALVRLAHRYPRKNLALVRERHLASGRHVTETVPFPDWVPAGVLKQAGKLSEAQALAALDPV